MLKTSARHPPDNLREALTKIEAARDDAVLCKTSINIWVGTLAIEKDTAYCLRSSGYRQDLGPLSNGECLIIRTSDHIRGRCE